MNLDTILKAATNSIPSTSPIANELQSRIENIGFASSYAEPGYTCTKGVLFSNWNKVTGWKQGEGYTQNYLPGHNIMVRLEKLLTKAGFECEWEDEWTTCCDCGKAVRTEPTSYCWTPSYSIVEGDIVCHTCTPVTEPSAETNP